MRISNEKIESIAKKSGFTVVNGCVEGITQDLVNFAKAVLHEDMSKTIEYWTQPGRTVERVTIVGLDPAGKEYVLHIPKGKV